MRVIKDETFYCHEDDYGREFYRSELEVEIEGKIFLIRKNFSCEQFRTFEDNYKNKINLEMKREILKMISMKLFNENVF